MKRNIAVFADDGLAGHFPFQIGHSTDEHAHHIVARGDFALLWRAYRHVVKHRIVGQIRGGLVWIVLIPSGHVVLNDLLRRVFGKGGTAGGQGQNEKTCVSEFQCLHDFSLVKMRQ